jgi:hypothetical protein
MLFKLSPPPGPVAHPTPAVAALAEHAAEIRRLGRQTVKSIIEIGRRLAECRLLLKEDGNWRSWLDCELKLSPQSAGRLIQVYEQRSKLEHLDLPVSALYLLAAPSTPKEVVNEIVERAQTGEPVSVAEVKRVVDTAKGKQPAKKSRREVYSKKPAAASTTATFEVAAELKDLVATKAPGWTGAIAGTQAEVDAAEERLRDDGAPGHWLIVAPRERVVVDHRVTQWLLLTAPAPPVLAHIEWVFSLAGAGNKARCPVWVSERLTGKSHPQRAGMTWPRELPIPREMPGDDIGADSRAEAARLRVRVDELQAENRRLEIKVGALESELKELKAATTPEPKSKSGSRCSICHENKRAPLRPIFICDNCVDIHEVREAAPCADDGLGIPKFLDRNKQTGVTS